MSTSGRCCECQLTGRPEGAMFTATSAEAPSAGRTEKWPQTRYSL